jgi:O-acetyl-ADP-ribose deacetylase (regulator of RNase III)
MRKGSHFLNPNFIGNKVSSGEAVLLCDYSLYSNGITTIKIPFVEEGQRPEDEYFSLGGEGILMQNGGNGFDTLDLEGVLILVGELV